MATTIKLKNSVTTTNAPSSLVQGEVAINITDKKVWVGNAATTPIQLLGDGASLNFTSLSLSGNLTFTGTGNRITGDFSNATLANRVIFQTSTTNGNTGIGIIPNGTSTTSGIRPYNNSDPTNAGALDLAATVTDMRISSAITGTGTYVPLTFYTGGSERLRIDTSGNLLVGTTTTRNRLTVAGTATTTPTLGTASGAALFAGTDLGYGTMIGTGSSGNGWIQQQRVDGTGTAYDLLLQPSGGNVGIGTSSPSTYGKFVVNGASNADAGIFIGNQSLTGSAPTYKGTVRIIDNPTSSTGTSGGLEFLTSTFGSGYGWKIASIDSSGVQLTFATRQNSASWTEAMRIDSSGNVGIGTSSPNALLTIAAASTDTRIRLVGRSADGTSAIRYYSSDNATQYGFLSFGNAYAEFNYNGSGYMGFATNNTERMRITSGGEVYIAGTTDQGAYNLQVNGTGVWGAGAYVNGSDERIKDKIAPLDSGLDVVAKLNPVTYKYKKDWSKDQSTQTGFIAQELLTALEGKNYVDGVVQQGGEYMSVAYQNIIPILTKAIQEQQAMIEELKQEVALLKSK